MQTGRFTVFDFDKLQDSEKYQNIISWANTIRNSYVNSNLTNYTIRRVDKISTDLPVSYYITRANEIIQQEWKTSPFGYIPLKTANEKMLFMTSFVFPDNQKFIDTLQKYGIEKEACRNFGEEIKNVGFYEESKTTMILDLLIQEYFENLDHVKIHYGTNNTGIIINKILEIAYLHPELLHTKEKS